MLPQGPEVEQAASRWLGLVAGEVNQVGRRLGGALCWRAHLRRGQLALPRVRARAPTCAGVRMCSIVVSSSPDPEVASVWPVGG